MLQSIGLSNSIKEIKKRKKERKKGDYSMKERNKKEAPVLLPCFCTPREEREKEGD